jgi:signal transduction histidine kinase
MDCDLKIEISQSIKTEGRQSNQTKVITRIRDHGIGIPTEELRKVFKPFSKSISSDHQQYHDEGFGLGLSLVVKVISAMRGKVWAEQPESGQGVVICIELNDTEGNIIKEGES